MVLRTDQKGVIFILNCTSVNEARGLIERLPLGQHHYMEFDYIALGPLTPLGALLPSQPAKPVPAAKFRRRPLPCDVLPFLKSLP